MKKNTVRLTGLLLLLFSGSVYAQEKHIEIGVLGGLSSVSYKDSQLSKGTTYGLSVDYSIDLTANWGISLGIMASQYKSFISKQGVLSGYTTKDIDSEKFEFRYKADRFQETLKGNLIEVPIQIRYQTTRNGALQFYAQTGLQYSIYSKVDSDLKWDNLVTSGYFPVWDAELFEPEFMGFGHFEHVDKKQKNSVKDSFTVLGEVGVKLEMAQGNALYMGVFAQADLTSDKTLTSSILRYNAQGQTPLEFNSTLKSSAEKDQALRAFFLGVKLRYAIGI